MTDTQQKQEKERKLFEKFGEDYLAVNMYYVSNKRFRFKTTLERQVLMLKKLKKMGWNISKTK